MPPERQKVHWNRSSFLCQLTVIIVLVISEALYFIPVENRVNKLHHISYLILKVFQYHIMFFALTSFSAVNCSKENLDPVKSASADLLVERCNCFFPVSVSSKWYNYSLSST